MTKTILEAKKLVQNNIFYKISDISENLGFETYVVGGFVRDSLIKKSQTDIKDLDFVTVGSGIKLANKVAQALEGKNKVQIFKNFGTAMISWKDYNLEFVGARKESYSKNSRNPVVENGSLIDDQKRRDFTINSLSISLNKNNYGKLIDPFNGLDDIKNKIIKTPLNPDQTFSDDPLRMIRAVRFSTKLNFNIDNDSMKSIIKNSNRIKIVSNERVVDELHKILSYSKPSIGFKLLEKLNILKLILPELTNLKGIDEIEGQKHKDNFYHTLEVVDNISDYTNNVWLKWAALLHDIGKHPTKSFNKKNGWTFHGHEFVGSKMVYKLFKRLNMPLNEKMKYVQKLVLLSSRPIVISEDNVTDSAVRRLVYDSGDLIDDLILLCKADITTKNIHRFEKYHKNFEIVKKKIKEVEQKDKIRKFQPPISGEEIMEYFGLNPCKEIGAIKEAIKEAILEGIIANEHKPAFDFMVKKGKEMGLGN